MAIRTKTLPGAQRVLLLAVLCWGAAVASAEDDLEARRTLVVKTVERARSAIVSIRTNQIVTRTWYDIWNRPLHSEPYERDGGLGSGTIFHPAGYVITNAHVISRASKIIIGITSYDSGGRKGKVSERRALPLAIDIANDLAILRLLPDADNPGVRYPFLRLASSDDLMVGESIVAMGHPFRLGLTVTQGIVSGLDRKLELGSHTFDDFMQVDAAINPGNSGGPLFDITGRWIGVNTAIYNRAHGAEGIGFAIPSDRVRSLLAASFKRRVVADDWLGIEFTEGNENEAIVERVYPKGPAAAAGLTPKGVVIAVNDQKTPTLYDLRMKLVAVPAGSTVNLSIREGNGRLRARTVSVPLEPVPTNLLSAKHFGFTAEDTGERTGVVVTEVRPDSPAERMLLRKSDVVFGLGQWKIENTEDLLMFLQFVAPGDLVDVKIRRPVGRSAVELKGSMRAE